MPSNPKQYREHLYRARNHPESPNLDGFSDGRDSLGAFYFSMVPFLAAEYLVEGYVSFMPSALVFPTGFLLFWTFYYCFYQPGILEEHLSEANSWDLREIPLLILGLLIWFVKLSCSEIMRFFKKTDVRRPQRAIHRMNANFYTLPPDAARANREDARAQFKSKTTARRPSPSSPKQVPPLPAEYLNALSVLGLSKDCRDWDSIHAQYRLLAKKFHPDLNHEITDKGNRFMACDAAYRRLASVRSRFFTN